MGGACCNGHEIRVKTDRQQMTVTSELGDTIKDLKVKIGKMKKLSQKQLSLGYNGRILRNQDRLQDTGFKHETDYLSLTIERDNQSTQQITVSIRNINFTQKFKIRANERVESLKRKIQKGLNFSVETQRLIFSGVVLDDKQLVSKYGIKEGSTIHLATKLTTA